MICVVRHQPAFDEALSQVFLRDARFREDDQLARALGAIEDLAKRLQQRAELAVLGAERAGSLDVAIYADPLGLDGGRIGTRTVSGLDDCRRHIPVVGFGLSDQGLRRARRATDPPRVFEAGARRRRGPRRARESTRPSGGGS